jgi:hypothetical protein
MALQAEENVFPGADWEGVRPEVQQVDPAKLTDTVEFLKSKAGRDGVRELVVVRNGRLIWEGWFPKPCPRCA